MNATKGRSAVAGPAATGKASPALVLTWAADDQYKMPLAVMLALAWLVDGSRQASREEFTRFPLDPEFI